MGLNTPNTEFLNNVTPVGQDNSVVQDINNYTPEGLSPQQEQQFQSQYTPATGQLSNSAYYPDLGNNIAVGNYSGSEIGSTTLFAPGGGLVPLGIMDARDAAVQRAALQKAKEIEDFKKNYQSPTTKHVAVQKNLTDTYYNQLQQWNDNALKKAGGDQAKAAYLLKNDPKFNAWNKSMQDTANFHNGIVEHSADLLNEQKAGRIIDPQTMKAQQELLSGVAYQGQNPFDEKGHNLGAKFLAAKTNFDLDKSVNEAVEKTIPNVDELKPEDLKAMGIDPYTSRGKNEIAKFMEKKYYSPEAIDNISHNVFMQKFQGTDVTEDQVRERVKANLGTQYKQREHVYDKWFKPPENKEVDYSNPVKTINKFNVETNSGTKEAHAFSYTPLHASDEKQELNFSINQGTKDKDLKGKTGSFKANLSGFGIQFVDKLTGEVSTITPEELDEKIKNGNLNHNLKAVPVAYANKKANIKSMPASELSQISQPLDGETEEQTNERVRNAIEEHKLKQEGQIGKYLPVPIEQAEGKFSKKTGQKIGVDDLIQQKKQEAIEINEKINASRKKTEPAKNASTKGKSGLKWE